MLKNAKITYKNIPSEKIVKMGLQLVQYAEVSFQQFSNSLFLHDISPTISNLRIIMNRSEQKSVLTKTHRDTSKPADETGAVDKSLSQSTFTISDNILFYSSAECIRRKVNKNNFVKNVKCNYRYTISTLLLFNFVIFEFVGS